MPAEAIRINRRVLLQCSIGAPGLKQPFAQPQQNGALSADLPFTRCAAIVRSPPFMSLPGEMLSPARMPWKGWFPPFAAPSMNDCYGLRALVRRSQPEASHKAKFGDLFSIFRR